MTTTGTTPGAARFMTGTTTTEVEKSAANLAATTADLAVTGAETVRAAIKGTGPPVRTPAGPAGLKTVPPQPARPFEGNNNAARGYAAPRGQSGVRSGAFSGYDHGGETRGCSSRGSASFGGGAARGGGVPHR